MIVLSNTITCNINDELSEHKHAVKVFFVASSPRAFEGLQLQKLIHDVHVRSFQKSCSSMIAVPLLRATLRSKSLQLLRMVRLFLICMSCLNLANAK